MKNPGRQFGCCDGVEVCMGRLRTKKSNSTCFVRHHCKNEPDWVL
jgi:hypothetical protein